MMAAPDGAAHWPPPGSYLDTSRADLEVAWPDRERDAALLSSSGSLSISSTMRVYALEIRIKLIICKHLGVDLLPRVCKTHDLSELIVFSGLLNEFLGPENDRLRKNWDILDRFSKKRLNDLRYLPSLALGEEEYRTIYLALDDPESGVLPWLSSRV